MCAMHLEATAPSSMEVPSWEHRVCGAATLFILVVSAAAALTCERDEDCTVSHQGLCAPIDASGGTGACVCGNTSWSPRLRACLSVERGASVTVNVTLLYAPSSASTALRFEAPPKWPAAWTCDAAQCRATERGAMYTTWRRDIIVAAAAAPLGTADEFVLPAAEVFVRCSSARRFLRVTSSGGSTQNDTLVQAWRHCATCTQWCGGGGVCASEADFSCNCTRGYIGARCNVPVASVNFASLAAKSTATAAEVATSAAIAATGALVTLLTASFPLYTLGRACAADGDCGVSEACWVNVSASYAALRVRRSCFCVTGTVPSDAAVGCVAYSGSADGSLIVYGATVALLPSATATARLLPVQAASDDGTQAGYIIFSNAAYTATTNTTTSVRETPSTVSAVIVGAMVTSTPVDTASSAYMRVTPALLACTDNATFATTLADRGISPLTWCQSCAVVCAGHANCGASETECMCASGFTGTHCDACKDTSLMAPECAQTYDACNAQRCSAHGVCLPGSVGNGCACHAGWAGANCSVRAGACGIHNCTGGRGQCSSTPGVCTCNSGWVGTDCGVSARECGAALCSARGNCTQDMRCLCDAGFSGASCEVPACANGGTAVTATTCTCPGGFTGDYCETNVCGAGTGAWNSTAGACSCYGVWRANDAGTIPVCSAHRCGQGEPLYVDSCLCYDLTHTYFIGALAALGENAVACAPRELGYTRAASYQARASPIPSDTASSTIRWAIPVALVAALLATGASVWLAERTGHRCCARFRK